MDLGLYQKEVAAIIGVIEARSATEKAGGS